VSPNRPHPPRPAAAAHRVAACLALLGAGLLAADAARAGEPLDLSGYELVDLTHAFGPDTVAWPTAPSAFELETLTAGETPGGWFYAAKRIHTPEHAGTHLDAPLHFARDGMAADTVPLGRLVAPAVVIDLPEEVRDDPDARLALDHVRAFEQQHGDVPAGSIVLLRTGWSARWASPERYLGGDPEGDASDLHFPSFGADAASFLVKERKVVALGVDTASLDAGASRSFPVHRLLAEAGLPGFENLTHLGRLPARGATLIALPMKVAAGTGAPLRAIALIPR